MVAPNPYINEDDDDDILGGRNDGGISSSDGRKKVNVRGVNGEELPPELREAISEYVNTDLAEFAPSDVGSSLPVEFRSVAWSFDYFVDFSRTKLDGPVMMAVAEVLDEMSNGQVSLRMELYEAERRIMWCQAVKRVINLFLSGAIVPQNNPYSGEMLLYWETYGNLVNFVYDTEVNKYRALSAKTGKEPDEEFIQTGILSERSAMKRIAMGYPYAQRDTD